MDRIVTRANFDSHLSFVRDGAGHGSLEIRIRTCLREFNPHLSPTPYAVFYTPTGDQVNFRDPGAIQASGGTFLVPWQGAFGEFTREFVRVVHEGWNNQLWLVHDSHGTQRNGAAFARYGIGFNVPTVLKCSLRLTLTGSDPQMVLLAGNTAPMGGKPMRVYMCAAGGLGGRSNGHSCGRMSFLTEQRSAYRGRIDDFDGLITNLDVSPRVSLYNDRYYWQTPACHEVGHYIGLNHVNHISATPGSEDAEYGVTPHQSDDLMGRGSRIEA